MENKTYDFIRTIINEDLKNNKNNGKVHTRFPPEPNGYLHIGHAKSILLNYGICQDYKGQFNLRFDDTNPTKEDTEYVEAIEEDVKWLGANWEDRKFFASNYFEKLHDFAVELIKMGKAYVCDLTADEVRQYRGTLTEAGKNSPYRERTIEQNLELFARMRAGEFEDGSKTLRAKIDMASPNMNMRDPAIYRIRRVHHHRTGDAWCIYPMYDFAHGLSDYIEGITHSICTLEFEDHRPLYDWFLIELGLENRPQQIEFARLNLSYTMMSKRKLLDLVENNYVNGWDDPRMPTISGMRRRGFTATAIQDFCKRIGVAKVNSMVDIALLEHCVKEELNQKATRVMAVIDPIKLVITNYPENQTEMVLADNNPEDETSGKREVPFSAELYIERDDFMEDAPRKYFRLTQGKEVRLKHAYYVTCTGFDKDENGEVTKVYATYDPSTKGGWSNDGRKVKGTLHWVNAKTAINAELRLYDHLFKSENPSALKTDYHEDLNPESLVIVKKAKLEPSLANAKPEDRFQFLRKGYYCLDKESTSENLVFNRTLSLKDSWAKMQKKMQK